MLEALAALLTAVLYASVLTCAGTVLADATLRLPPELADTSTRLIARSALLTIAASIGRAGLLVLRLGGQWDDATLSAVFMSGSGAATCLQLVGAALLLASLNDPSARVTRLANVALLPLSFAFSGHAGAEGLAQGLVVFVHASAAAWWVGSLWLLREVCVRSSSATTAGVIARFSGMATTLVGILVLAGLLLVGLLVNFASLPALAPYEAILAVKLFIVALALATATYNRVRLTPRVLAGDGRAAPALRRTVDVELGLVGLVVATTAILTTFTSPS